MNQGWVDNGGYRCGKLPRGRTQTKKGPDDYYLCNRADILASHQITAFIVAGECPECRVDRFVEDRDEKRRRDRRLARRDLAGLVVLVALLK
jgi:hypothetical protein